MIETTPGNQVDVKGLAKLLQRSVLSSVFLLCWLVLFVGILTGNVFAQNSPRFTASVQPARVTVGDALRYEVTVELTGAGQPSVAVPMISSDTGLSAPAPDGQQSSVETYVSGTGFRSVQKVINAYLIRTSKAGTFTIPPSTVTLNGRTYETNPVQVTVENPPQARGVPKELEGLVAAPVVSGNTELQRRLTGGLFVLPVLSKTNPYNGEQVRISYHLVIDPAALQEANLQPRTNLDGVNIPALNEFITEELFPFPQDLKFQERKIGGQLYLVAPVYEAVIASTKSGELKIEPFQISMYFSQTGQRQTRQLPAPFANDPFFSSMAPLGMMGGNTVQVIAQSPELTLDVKPVPQAGQPAGYGGAVGEFEVTAEVDKRQARAYDDTVQLRLKVEGEGNTESLSAPPLPQMPGFTVLGNPSSRSGGQKSGDTYISEKTFEYVLRPTISGTTEIPPIEVPYFDSEEEVFKVAVSDAIAMEIAPGTRPAPAPAVEPDEDDNGDEGEQPEVDLRYVATGTLPHPDRGLSRLWGWLGAVMFLMPPAIVCGAIVAAWKRGRDENRVVDSRKMFRSAADQHLREASTALNNGDAKLMAAKLAEGIRLHFAARSGLSAAEVTIPEIEERLAKAGAPEDVVQGIAQVLEVCDGAQYGASSAISPQAGRAIYDDAIALLKRTEEFV